MVVILRNTFVALESGARPTVQGTVATVWQKCLEEAQRWLRAVEYINVYK